MLRIIFCLCCQSLFFSSLNLGYAQIVDENEDYSIERAVEDLGGLSKARNRGRYFLLRSGLACLPALEAAAESSDYEVATSARLISQHLRDHLILRPQRLPDRLKGTPEEVYLELESRAGRDLPKLHLRKDQLLPNRIETFGHSLWTHFNSYCDQLNLKLKVENEQVCLLSSGTNENASEQQRFAVGPLLFVIEQVVKLDPADAASPIQFDILVLVERELAPALRITPVMVGTFDLTGNFGVKGAKQSPLYFRSRTLATDGQAEESLDFAYRTNSLQLLKADTSGDRLNGVVVIQTNYLLFSYPQRPLTKLNAGWRRIVQLEVENLKVK